MAFEGDLILHNNGSSFGIGDICSRVVSLGRDSLEIFTHKKQQQQK